MARIVKTTVLALAVLFMNIGTSQATLIDRGAGLIYDDVLDVTWLQDVDYAGTKLNLADASDWTANLAYEDTLRGTVWDDWRLPSTDDVAGSLIYDTTGTLSELSYMYYVNLGYEANLAHDRFSPAPTSTAYNPFTNFSYRAYWSSTVSSFERGAWILHMHFGSLELDGEDDLLTAWAVRDGDVGDVSVPEPATLALMGIAMAGFGFARRKTKTA